MLLLVGETFCKTVIKLYHLKTDYWFLKGFYHRSFYWPDCPIQNILGWVPSFETAIIGFISNTNQNKWNTRIFLLETCEQLPKTGTFSLCEFLVAPLCMTEKGHRPEWRERKERREWIYCIQATRAARWNFSKFGGLFVSLESAGSSQKRRWQPLIMTADLAVNLLWRTRLSSNGALKCKRNHSTAHISVNSKCSDICIPPSRTGLRLE